MKILSDQYCYRWLGKHGYEYQRPFRLPIAGTRNKFKTDLQILLPEHNYVVEFEPLTTDDHGLRAYMELAGWLNYDFIIIFQTWTADEGGLPGYLKKFCPECTSAGHERGLINDAQGPLGRQEIVRLFADFVEMNWQAYVLSASRQWTVWLADEVIEAGTNDPTMYNAVRKTIHGQP